MQKVTFTNARGVSISFGYSSPIILSSIEGLGDVAAENLSQRSPYQDGETHVDTRLEPRYIPVRFLLIGNVTQNRKNIASILNPKLSEGILRYENGGEVREIACIPESVPYFPSGDARGPNYQEGTVTFKAHNPYWQSIEETTEPLQGLS